METLDVRIVQLEPLRVASAHGFGSGPEGIAWDKLSAWAKQHGLWQDGSGRRYFGFNNPNPAEGSPNYGYETWVTVEPEVASEGEITVKDVPGGLYAVTRCVVKAPWEDIPSTWKRLTAWVETSPYRPAGHQWLEETFFDGDPNYQAFTLDLYFPIR
jgi:DNA gyrase inhibitor GyrI